MPTFRHRSFALLALLAAAVPSLADEGQPLDLGALSLAVDGSASWTFRATASPWFASLNGEQILRGGPKFDIDNIDQPDVQVSPRLELAFRRERWTVIGSGFLFNIDQSAAVKNEPLISGGTTVNVGDRVSYDLTYASADLLVGYRIAEIPLDNGDGRGPAADPFSVPSDGVGLFFDLTAGVRVWHLDYTMDEVGGGNLIDVNDTWVDPFVGVRMLLDLPYGTGLEVRGDVGGFGVGSEFAWNIEVAFQASITDSIGAEIGFRHLQTRYETGSGAELFEWDMALAGLYGSVVIRF